MSDKKNKKEIFVNLGFGVFVFGISYTLFHYIPDMTWLPVISIAGGFGMVVYGLKND